METIYGLIQFNISIIFILLYFVTFLPLRYSKGKTFLICLVAFAFSVTVSSGNFFRADTSVQKSICNVLVIVFIQLTALWLSAYRDFRTLFLGITSAVFVYVGSVFYMICYRENLMNPVLGLILQTFIFIFIWKVLQFLLRDAFTRYISADTLPWGLLCVIPLLIYILSNLMTMRIKGYTQEWVISELVLFGCLQCLIMAAFIIIIKLYASEHDKMDLEEDMQYMDAYAAHLKKEASYIQDKEREAAIMRHDMRHHFHLLNTYLETGNIEAAQEFLAKIDEYMADITPKKFCNNLAINHIMIYFDKVAQQKNVIFQANIALPDTFYIDEYELATVVSNLLDNAINGAAEVTEGERLAQLKIQTVKKQLLLETCNTYSGKIIISPETGMPLTNKGEGHGYGVKSILAFADKYAGIVDYSYEKCNGNDFLYCRILINHVR